MTNPLFARGNNSPSSKPNVFVDPAEKAFGFLVPPGWTADGKLLRLGRNGRYIVFNVNGPDGSLVFSGHADLPQRYFVPSPWHGYVPPGRRTKMNAGGPAEEDLFPAPLGSAPQLCQHLASRRFGPITMMSAVQLPDMMRETYQAAAQAGSNLPFIDACRAEFTSTDGSRVGAIQLVVFGGGHPGETWQVENISGYWCPAGAKLAASSAHGVIMASLKADDTWLSANADQVQQAVYDLVDRTFREKDAEDRGRILEFWGHRLATTQQITQGMIDSGTRRSDQVRGLL